MATIQKRTSRDGAVSYRVQIRLKGVPPQTGTFDRLTDARKWAASTESAIREGRFFKTSAARRHTLADAIKRYRETHTIDRNKNRYLNWWQERLGDYALADVTADKITEYRDALAGGTYKRPGQKSTSARTPATCNRYLAALSVLLNTAVREWEWLENNPCRNVKKLAEPPGRVRFLSDAERDRLLKACQESPAPYLHLVVVLALSTGARYMEILGLQWQQVDMKRGTVHLEKTKNRERRTLPLRGKALELMREHSRVRRMDSQLVFPSPNNPAEPVDARSAFETALVRASITDFRFHDLRHSAASYLAMNNASLAEIAEILGHKTI